MGAVRNYAEIGNNVQNIVKKLFANQKLLKLLYYTDKDPLNNADLTSLQIRNEVYQNLILITPRISGMETAQSILALRVINGYENASNDEIKDIKIGIEVFVPLTQWIIKDTNLRPFAIMGEIQRSLDRQEIKGFGTLKSIGFNLNFLTEEISDYLMTFSLQTYD